MQSPPPPEPTPHLDRLSDDLLRKVLRAARPHTPAVRVALLRASRRIAALLQAETTLAVDLECDKWPTALAGVGRMLYDPVDDCVACRVSVHADVATLSRFSSRLSDALELAQLAHRRSAARAAVRSLRLHRRSDLGALLPRLVPQLASARPGRLRAVTLTRCALPPNLGEMLAHVQRLTLWECTFGGGRGGDGGTALVEGLAALPLETLFWAGGREGAPAALLEAPRAGPPRRLGLGFKEAELDGLAAARGGRQSLALSLGGDALEELRRPPLFRDTAATRPLGAGRADVDAFAAGVVSAAGFADDCALHMAAAYTAALFPALERLLIEWYDNDDLPAGGVARALAPLRGCSSLRELHLCRSDADCGSIDADAQSFARAFVAGGEGAAPCPALRVCVHDAPGRGFDGGETAWAIECGFLPWCRASE
ncbi:hypothetical protein EMIHUDRAFT_219980 [Emiliania huxleyi CCMP1516]|uniref:F-box domain-containing protein n=2 Tax=Emiliania huxleyi TaxID=2903 RepID=A0A0D3I2S9_EMIH1|nr:hypothetical protein EMIHUDRAFT_219980 [Emiliania huxleyi CCMP1516]EOD05564.1 hypothetical protein EMIHUDRAFT_219980 [Emiliania huxleyi CCMP1516]|eukprot:XP_005757993.1 hypothetical protein EMIHUDRAFT_219980 [Emiliania huxleyi CCMP1516]